MGNLIRPTKVHVITKEGECQLSITIDLNINLNTGIVDLKQREVPEVAAVEEEKESEEKPLWAIPTFKSDNKVKFGKRKEE